MSEAIISTYEYIQNIIDNQGDGIIPAGKDPIILNQHHGAYIEVWSVNGHFLTWSYLEGVTVAMYNALFLRARYKTSNFNIWDGAIGMIGVGNLRRGETALPKTSA